MIDFFFFFSSRRRHTRLTCDWSSDVCSSDLMPISELGLVEMTRKRVRQDLRALLTQHCPVCRGTGVVKSDETLTTEIGRASCRERVEISVVAAARGKNKRQRAKRL